MALYCTTRRVENCVSHETEGQARCQFSLAPSSKLQRRVNATSTQSSFYYIIIILYKIEEKARRTKLNVFKNEIIHFTHGIMLVNDVTLPHFE